MAYNSNFRFSEITGANPVTITNEAQVVVDLSYKSAGARGVLLSEAALKESPSTIVMVVGGTTFNEVDISAFTGAANTFAVEYASNSGVIFLPPGTALGTATTTTYKGLGSVATVESKQYNLDGTVGAPGISFADDPDTGRYRIGANQIGESIGGVKVAEWGDNGLNQSGLLVQRKIFTRATATTHSNTANTYTWTGQSAGAFIPKYSSTTSEIYIIVNLTNYIAGAAAGAYHGINLRRDTSVYTGTPGTTTNTQGLSVYLNNRAGVGNAGGNSGFILNFIVKDGNAFTAGSSYYYGLFFGPIVNATSSCITQFNNNISSITIEEVLI